MGWFDEEGMKRRISFLEDVLAAAEKREMALVEENTELKRKWNEVLEALERVGYVVHSVRK